MTISEEEFVEFVTLNPNCTQNMIWKGFNRSVPKPTITKMAKSLQVQRIISITIGRGTNNRETHFHNIITNQNSETIQQIRQIMNNNRKIFDENHLPHFRKYGITKKFIIKAQKSRKKRIPKLNDLVCRKLNPKTSDTFNFVLDYHLDWYFDSISTLSMGLASNKMSKSYEKQVRKLEKDFVNYAKHVFETLIKSELEKNGHDESKTVRTWILQRLTWNKLIRN